MYAKVCVCVYECEQCKHMANIELKKN